jgi:DNA-binding NtrC family response regulator
MAESLTRYALRLAAQEDHMTQSLAGKTVLIVEDEIIIGMMLNKEIACAGGTPIGPVATVADALKQIDSQRVDAVILDAKLVDGWGGDLATCLEQNRIPYVVTSGYEEGALPKELGSAPFIAKPISLPLLIEALEGVVAASMQSRSPDQLSADVGPRQAAVKVARSQ